MSNSSAFIAPVDHGSASTGYMIINAALVFLMIPGIGFFYSGMSRSKNALSMIMITFLTCSIVTVQWVAFGFSLTFSETGSAVIGNCQFCGLINVDARSLPLTASQIPVSDWTWSARGWLRNLACLDTIAADKTPCQFGVLDFAGGGPVHVCSGFSGLAYSMILGRRRRMRSESFRPHNMTLVFLGTALLWFGWFGFNAGSALDATPRAAMAGLTTTIATASGALAWCLWDMIFSGQMSGLGFCSGAVAALVGITPGAGFVEPWAAIVIGALSGVLCNLGCRLKGLFGFDDALDAWGIHGVGGFFGSILTGIFAQKVITTLDGSSIQGGAIDGNWIQIAYQLASVVTIGSYSFIMTFLILLALDIIPGLHLRPTEADEAIGADITEMGEMAYELLPQNFNGDFNPKSEV
ncbi:hypothetical protein HK096_005866 [Nowakowskiella sp. JEL0078]|nr:hypothetical protein HK096_005866 [Nowakowskiella sp. JEL0078]